MAWKGRSKGMDPLETAFLFYPAAADLSTYLPEKINPAEDGAGRKEVRLLKTISLETTDIFRGAFFLCKGGDLSEVRICNNSKRIASFLITGKDLDKLDRDYRSGKALVNPLQFRESLNHLRDILFEKLRESEGRMSNDRKGKDRIHQTKH